ncbi:hypothetical protein EIN_308160 [Entamoeba invadens IP1]|uniref:tRNA (adenine(58)-N(1))-methyltransferase non-catalytic subunit TRM6 n=1 Tax=Entamoeba invadens IP1 TaxID=370355 RepID=A0A0A1TYZ7_ENTIV|nr:hypothetical protein EIN_308160 [Entamoeba invadens IP1]ELP86750.1 hypothetical protein EIN_308160 [Entamoeba invadens IP1]|eukprot:XP_004186096.1 hypothetical protein EIN_308160 [Entamoeba invadens IP1]
MEVEANSKCVVCANDWVVLKRDDFAKVVEVVSDRSYKVSKCTVNLSSLVGKRYGQWVEIKGHQFVTGKSPDEIVNQFCQSEDEVTKDNRNLNDQNTAQHLTSDDISKMKSEGLAGEEIISELLKKSDTFEGKTGYSQTKYLKKKVEKHVICFQILEASPINLCSVYSSKGAFKVGKIREDALAYILFNANLRGSVAVLESCNGLIIGSILRAVTDNLHVYAIRFSKEQYNLVPIVAPKRDRVPSRVESVVTPIDSKTTSKDINSISKTVNSISTSINITSQDVNHGSEICQDGIDEVIKEVKEETQEPKELKELKETKQEKLYGYRIVDFKPNCLPVLVDSLVIVCHVNPLETVRYLFQSLKKSGSLVVYSQYLEGLSRLYNYLTKKKALVHYGLFEPFCRTIQVLPNRTHPTVLMDSLGGYIMYGIKVSEAFDEVDGKIEEKKDEAPLYLKNTNDLLDGSLPVGKEDLPTVYQQKE